MRVSWRYSGAVDVLCGWKDNKGKLSDLVLPNNSDLQPWSGGLLEGVTTLWKDTTLIPYYAWANRGRGDDGGYDFSAN